MSQDIEHINIKDLVLWTENPRDPIDSNATDQDIAKRAIDQDQRGKWSLKKLLNAMGPRYDKSELPTVVYIKGKPVVFDGNRRMLIGKIKHNLVTIANSLDFSKLDFPQIIPCNVCDEQTALENVQRKHAGSGSWDPLERDIFEHNRMGAKKSSFMIVDEATGLISDCSEINKGFVKKEVLNPTNLESMGFYTDSGFLEMAYQNQDDASKILLKVKDLVVNEKITTRGPDRGEIVSVLKKDNEIETILNNQTSTRQPYKKGTLLPPRPKRKTRTGKPKEHEFFGGTLSLQPGTVNNIYSDLRKLYGVKGKSGYSNDFPMLIRMGLRLLCEIAAEPLPDIASWVKDHFDNAKKKLSKDEKTTLNSENVTKNTLIGLLQYGAHNYTANNNMGKTVAMSLIIGKMLEVTHGKL